MLVQIPLHLVEFCRKLKKEEGWKSLYIAPVGIPWVFGRTLYQSWRILVDSLQHCTVLKLDPYGQVTRLDIEHEDVTPRRPWYQFEFPEKMICFRGRRENQRRASLMRNHSSSSQSPSVSTDVFLGQPLNLFS